MALFCLAVPQLHWDGPVPLFTDKRQNITGFSSYTLVFFSTFLFLQLCLSICTLTFLFHSPCSFIFFHIYYSILYSGALCLFFLFNVPSLSSWPSWLYLLHLSSAALVLSLIIWHQNIFSLLPCGALSWPCNIEVRRDTLLFSIKACWKSNWEQERGRAMSSTAEKAKGMYFDCLSPLAIYYYSESKCYSTQALELQIKCEGCIFQESKTMPFRPGCDCEQA